MLPDTPPKGMLPLVTGPRSRRSRDLTGCRFGRLVFLEPVGRVTWSSGNAKVVWKVACDCGRAVYCYHWDFITSGRLISCGCMTTELQSKANERKRKLPPKLVSARNLWRQSYPDMEFDFFYELSQQPCHYCKRLPHREHRWFNRSTLSTVQREQGGFIYNGIDRVDNPVGHAPGNVVPCCWDCNHMKSDRTLEKFKEQVRRIYVHSLKDSGFP